MAILSGDVKLLKSAVMADVVEGGGAPTGLEVVDGLSNAIFPDISELDRAGGRVNLRKTFLSVQTSDTDLYFGANVIVAEPPADPRVSITLFSNKLTFDTRFEAQKRIEAYLNRGPELQPYLFENHIYGQRVLQYFQRPAEEIINVGHTWVLIHNEGTPTEYLQYVRATKVSSVVKMFYDPDSKKDYPARVVSIEISDSLRYDFPGSPADISFQRKKEPTTVNGVVKGVGALTRDTVVADAGTYVGVVPLLAPATMGEFTVHGSSIYTQLVPSAQTETPIADSRPTQQTFAFVGTGGPIVQNLTLAFTNTQNMFIGGMIMPGTLSIARAGITLTDKGSQLMNGAVQVGTVDYENGIITLLSNIWGSGGGTHVVIYSPAAKFEGSLKSTGFQITQETRSLSFVRSLEPSPKPGTLTVSYMVARRWYVLKDYGGGELHGLDTAYGAGTINYDTGTVSVTVGALPDVDSAVIFQWVDTGTQQDVLQTPIRRFSRLATPVNTAGTITAADGPKGIQPSGLTMTWLLGAVQKTCTDNGLGRLIGDADGYVDYSGGVVWWSPNIYPAKDTIIGMDINGALPSVANSVPIFGGVVSANLAPLSIYFEISAKIQYSGKQRNDAQSGSVAQSRSSKYGYGNWGTIASNGNWSVSWASSSGVSNVIVDVMRTLVVRDNGVGGLYFVEPGNETRVPCGYVNYTTGEINVVDEVLKTTLPADDMQGPVVSFSSAGSLSYANALSGESVPGYWYTQTSINVSSSNSQTASWQERWNEARAAVNGTREAVIAPQSVNVRYRNVGFSVDSITFPLTAAMLEFDLSPYNSLGVLRYDQGGKSYLGVPSGALLTDISPATGKGTTVGEMVSGAGKVVVTQWVAGASPVITNLRCAQVPPGDGPSAPGYSTDLMFRTAAAPLRPGSFQIVGTMMDGSTFNVTAGADGKISGTRCVGTIDYEVGLIKLWFIKRTYDQDTAVMVNYGFLGIAGLGVAEVDMASVASLRYNAVSYSYLPLDAQLLGIDPVRLPSDGKVPIFRAGGFGVVGHTGKITTSVTNGMVVDCGRVRLSRVRVLDINGVVLNTGYTTDLEAGTVTFTNVSTYAQPVTVEHRVEDMAVIRDAQINGDITFTRALTHNYPMGSVVSSALIAGDRFARVSLVFDQVSWNSVFSDDLTAANGLATFNAVQFPIVVTNRGAVTERWVLRFTSSTAFDIIGEHVGVIGSGNTSTNCAPVNPATNVPYFTVPALGWGSGWSVGYVLRINTIGSEFPVWVVRTVQQGPETVLNDSFTLLVRGDVDTP